MENIFESAFLSLYRWIERERFVGYDPYDGLNSDIAILSASPKLRLLVTYANKVSPINLRKLMKIRKSGNIKALALISRALMRFSPSPDIDPVVEQHLDYLVSRSLIDRYGYHCWYAHEFPVQTLNGYGNTATPGIIGTEVCGSALLEYYQSHPQRAALRDILLSVGNFLVDVLLVKRGEATFFKYKPVTPPHECVYNASLIASSYLLRMNRYLGIKRHEGPIRDCYAYVRSRQKADGSWFYGIDLRTGREKKQIDFHQGYILDAILDYLETFPNDNEMLECYARGVAFYRRKQFSDDGQSLYRYPRRQPVDIHNQAQGIITFFRAGGLDPEYASFAHTIARWTIANMRSEEGYFFYQKHPLFTNKIPYLRWGQAWMLFALAHLMKPS